MHLVLGGINGEYLRNITLVAASSTAEVVAAVAYASDDLLLEWCWDNNIPLRYYGKLDASVAVSTNLLKLFLSRRSPNFVCRLVEHLHAKIIWWRGYGMYVGSANLTQKAWSKGVEAGCFFSEEEITDEMSEDISRLFGVIEQNSTPLTKEVYDVMVARSLQLDRAKVDDSTFWKSPSLKRWSGLVQTGRVKARDQRRQDFLAEWHSTLQDLRDIGTRVSQSQYRPMWISGDAPSGAQADQFLHAHYYQRTFDGQRANYAAHFEDNRTRREQALTEAMGWWAGLPHAPENEDRMINNTAPFLRSALSEGGLSDMDKEGFIEMCMGVHAILDYGRRVPNRSVMLPDDGTKYTIPQKVRALATRIWADRSAERKSVVEMLTFVLYGGPDSLLPERLWDAVSDPKWKIDGLGISAIGEIVGWALPDRFPPRNGRTSKALRSLGYEAKIHVQ